MSDEQVSKTTSVVATSAAAAGAAAGLAGHSAADLAGPGGAVVTSKVVKPGWRSSELWVTLGLPFALQGLGYLSHVPGPWGMLAGALGAGLYSLSRAQVKK